MRYIYIGNNIQSDIEQKDDAIYIGNHIRTTESYVGAVAVEGMEPAVLGITWRMMRII